MADPYGIGQSDRWKDDRLDERPVYFPAAPTAPVPPETVTRGTEALGAPRDVSLGIVKTTAPAPLVKPAPPARPSIATLEGVASETEERLDTLGLQRQRITDASTEELEQAKARAAGRTPWERAVHTSIDDLERAIGAPRPSLDALREKLLHYPTPPDVQIRPWLDPEGKSAINVITQGLSAIALGVGGLVQKAPMTALRQFREAAEDWRRNEVDASNSKLRQFEMTVQTIQNENRTALEMYDLADRRYLTNVTAKQAAVAGEMQRLQMYDTGTKAALLPYDLARQNAQDAFDNTVKMQDGLTKYFAVWERYARARDMLPKTLPGMRVRAEQLKAAIATTTDPEQKKQLEAELAVVQASASRMLADKRLIAQDLTGLGIARVQLGKLETGALGLDQFVGSVVQFSEVVDRLDQAGMLPDDPTPLAQLGTWAQRNITQREKWQQRGVQEAYQEVLQRLPGLLVNYERNIESGAGAGVGAPRIREAFNIPHDPTMLSARQLRGIIRMSLESAKRVRDAITIKRGEYWKMIGTPPPGGVQAGEDDGDQ